MQTKYNVELKDADIAANLKRIQNSIFKLLPYYEEEKDWKKPLDTIVIELIGLSNLFENQTHLIALVSKLEGIRHDPDIEFPLFRRMIFECCSLVDKVRDDICQ